MLINSHVGENKKRNRVWIEGRKLENTAFCPYARYTEVETAEGIELVVNAEGKHKVSGRNATKPDVPTSSLIEYKSDLLERKFEKGQPIRIELHKDRIVIKVHHFENDAKRREKRAQEKIKRGIPLNIMSLCHGGGILDNSIHAGFEDVGIPTRLAIVNELQQKYLDSSLKNNAHMFDDKTVILEGDMRGFTTKNVTPKHEVDGIVIGIACESSSTAGRAKNKNKVAEAHEKTGDLAFWFLQFLNAFNPAYCILENVVPYKNTGSYHIILKVLDTLGYNVQMREFEGNEFGALENRERMVMIATSKGISGFDINSVLPSKTKEAKFSDILDFEPLDSDVWKPYDYIFSKEKRDIEAGKGFRSNVMTGEETTAKTTLKGYAKVRSGEILIKHPKLANLYRLMSTTEHARAKSIPPKLLDGNSKTTAHEIAGQSVIWSAFRDFAYYLGQSIKEWAISPQQRIAA